MILSRKYGLAIIMAVIIFIPNVCAIKMSVSSGNGVSYSGDFRMDTSASLTGEIQLSDQGIFQDTKASGKGKNALIESIGGNGYNGESSLVASGSFSTSSSSVVTSNAGMISQDVSAEGDASIGASASAATGTAVQQASVSNGALSSSQSLGMGSIAVATLDTAIYGDYGSINSLALSQGNVMTVAGGFSGEDGKLDAQMVSVANMDADVYGSSSIEDVECFNSGDPQYMAGGTYIEGLYPTKSGSIGSFNLLSLNSRENVQAAVVAPSNSIKAPAIIPLSNGAHPEILKKPLGKSDSYVVSNKKGIDPAKPLQIYLKNDANLNAEGLTSDAVNQALVLATGTWDYYTKPNQNNLFAPTVINDPSKDIYPRDGFSVHAFKDLGKNCIAVAKSYPNDAGFYTESDIIYNINAVWTTDWNTAVRGWGKYADFQTIALHELGHSAGLGDLYNLGDARKRDLNQIMNYYSGPKHNLGAGDIKGLQTIYGA